MWSVHDDVDGAIVTVSRFRTVVCIALVLVSAGCGTAATPTPTAVPQGVNLLQPPTALNDFTLTNQANKPMKLSDLKGKLALMTFGYSNCPDVCPITLAKFKQIKAQLAGDAGNVAFVFISVDGVRDPPDVLTTYLNQFDSSFVGLTGDEPTMRKIGKDYFISFEADHTTGSQHYLVTHSSYSFLVDREGRLSRIYAYETPAEVMTADIKQVMGKG
jgi:protein SCO1